MTEDEVVMVQNRQAISIALYALNDVLPDEDIVTINELGEVDRVLAQMRGKLFEKTEAALK